MKETEKREERMKTEKHPLKLEFASEISICSFRLEDVCVSLVEMCKLKTLKESSFLSTEQMLRESFEE